VRGGEVEDVTFTECLESTTASLHQQQEEKHTRFTHTQTGKEDSEDAPGDTHATLHTAFSASTPAFNSPSPSYSSSSFPSAVTMPSSSPSSLFPTSSSTLSSFFFSWSSSFSFSLTPAASAKSSSLAPPSSDVNGDSHCRFHRTLFDSSAEAR